MKDKSDKEDHSRFIKNTYKIGSWFLVGSLMGLGVNRVLSNSGTLPIMIYFRYPLRLMLFLMPNLIFYPVYD